MADRTSMSTVTTALPSPSEAVKSKFHWPTSSACGVQRKIAEPVGVLVNVARSPMSLMLTW